MTAFHTTTFAQDLHFGVGALDRLPEAVAAFGWQRLVVFTTGSARRSGRAGRVQALLGARAVAVFDRAQAHVPAAQVAEGLALAAAHEADALVGLGGGSAIGLAKAVSAALEAQRAGRPARAAQPTDQPLVPVVAVPTTYAGSEMTAVYGVTETDAAGSRKVTYADPKFAPNLVIYDPALTLDLPPEVTATTGLNALAHAIEAVYSTRRHPLATAAALAAVGHVARSLPRCYTAGDDLPARTDLLLGAHLAGAALAGVAMGLHHGLCHVLGGAAGVPHGVANGLVLPHALRFNLDAVTPELAQVAQALGAAAPPGGSEAALAQAGLDQIDALIAGLGVPRRLRDVGVRREAFPRLAELALHSAAVRANPKPVTSAAQVLSLLEAAW